MGFLLRDFAYGSLLLLVAAAFAGCDQSSKPVATTPQPMDALGRMRAAMDQGDWQRAGEYSQSALVAHPNDPEVLTDAAKVAAMCGRKRQAALMMVDAVAASNYGPPEQIDFTVQALIDVGELYEVFDLLEASLRVHPDNHKHRRMLVGLLGEAQRTDLVPPHYEYLIRHRVFDIPLLVAITESSARRFSPRTPKLMMERNPEDHRVRLAEAHYLSDTRDNPDAQRVCEEILKHHPNFAPAHALLGQILVSLQRFDKLDAWFDRSPPESEKYYADYWLTLGDWATDRDQLKEAARAYWEATRRDADDSLAWSRLATALRSLRHSGSAAASLVSDEQLDDIDRRVADLLELRKQFHAFAASDQTSQRYATEIARALWKLRRNWEAEAWAAAAMTLSDDPSQELPQLRQKIIAALQKDRDWVSTQGYPALSIDLSNLDRPVITSKPKPVRNAVIPAVASIDHLQLSEESDRWGLTSIGAKSSPTDASLGPLIRSTGIGGGAIDYDLDGRFDSLVMGAGGTILQYDSHPNELMRNVGDRFERVTPHAGVGHTGFGQGVCVGDFNEDGFPDLFYANLGRNCLLRNNGDGTFTDCSSMLEDKAAQEWTTCGAFADIDGDRIPDLITTNYCQVVQNLDKPCPNSEGVDGPCHPLKFPAMGDRYFAGSGDGRLNDVTSQWIPPVSPGRGLGILAGSLSGNQFAAFIANDMSANEYYTLRPDEQTRPRLTESAVVRGLAVDARSLSQASMGIASGDLDGDGDLDIYVTGFGKEYNIFYEQTTPGFWKDATGSVELIEPTLQVVGFGTEAVDLDDDGIDELLVTNGHIGEFDDDTLSYEQPFQVFRRGGDGAFQLLNDDAWGDYFAASHVGRALWTIDANTDGRSDVMVTHTHEQVALLINRGNDDNNRVAFKLVGTQMSRDAVGAVIRFRAGGRDRVLWRLSGDGYMCSNESVLRAGLEKASQIEDVTVTWQDGSVDRLGSLDANAEYVVVQGQASAFQSVRF